MPLSNLFDRLFPKSPAPSAVVTSEPLGEPPAELVAALRGGTCILFTGEEFSRQCGLPVWNYLMLGIGEYLADSRRIERSDGDRIREIHRNKSFAHLEKVVRLLLAEHPDALPEYLTKIYVRPVMMPPPHEWLKKLPFAAVVTPTIDAVASRLGKEVVRLRGDFVKPETVRFWPDEAEGPARATCAEAVQGKTVLFAGTSAAEIERWFGVAGAGPHFALTPEGQSLDSKMAAKYGVRSLVFDPKTSQPVVEFLKKLDVATREDHAESANAAG